MDRAGRMAHDDPRAFFAEHGWLVVRAAVPPSRVRVPVDDAGRLAEAVFPTVYRAPP